jgi:hypothetical protein
VKLKHDDLVKLILDALNYSGIPAWPTHKVGAYKHKPIVPGISDILGILEHEDLLAPDVEGPVFWMKPIGQWLSIEVKIGKDKLSEDQEEFKRSVEAAGGIYIEARALEDVTNHPALKERIKVK